MSKIVTLAAAATGYVLGTRAGRQRYEQISTQAQKLWQDPRVQKAASDARETAAAKAPVVKDKVSKMTGGKVGGTSNGSSDMGTSPTSTTPSTSATSATTPVPPPVTPPVASSDDPTVSPSTPTTVSSPGTPTV
jgi:hypothetical protein